MKFGVTDRIVGMLWGVTGGSTKYFLDISAGVTPRGQRIMDACIIAALSALCGLLVKDLHQWVKNKFNQKKDI